MTPVIEDVVTLLFGLLIIIPLMSLISLTYLVRLVKDVVYPPVLLILLTVEAAVSFTSSTYVAALTVNTRVLGHTNPPELLPVTLLALIAPLVMINIIALVLFRANGVALKEKGKKRIRRAEDKK